MKMLTSLSLMFLVLNLIGQTQLHVKGSSTDDPVAQIDILDNTNPVTGLLINVPEGDHRGIDIQSTTDGTGITVTTVDGIGGVFTTENLIGLAASTDSPFSFGYGMYGLNTGSGEGTGVYGHASSPTGSSYGVIGQSNSATGTGVYGYANSIELGEKIGVHGESLSIDGIGVFGENKSGKAVYGFSNGSGIGVKGESLRGFGGEFSSVDQPGISSLSEDSYGIVSMSLNNSGAYIKGEKNTSDLVLGIDREIEGEDDGIISADLSKKTTDIHMIANDQIIIELDNDDDEDSYLQVLNGANSKILTLDESGNLDISGALSPMSDINQKHDIIETDYKEILNKLSDLKIYNWKYNGDNRPHLGPMAQDFYSSFNLNNSDTTIATVDADGIALASIKALQNEVEELKTLVRQLMKSK